MGGRGGHRNPSGGPRVSGVGKNSQRSDANQPIDVGRVGDSEDLKHGDRQKLEAAMRQRPIARAESPEVASAAPAPVGMPGIGGPAQMPEFLAQMQSVRPMEDPMAPASQPFEPVDEVDEVLQGLVAITGDQGMFDMLTEHREFKAWKTTGRQEQAPAPTAPVPQEAPPTDEGPMEVATLGAGLSAQPELAPEGSPSGTLPEDTPAPEEMPASEEGGEPSPSSPTSDVV